MCIRDRLREVYTPQTHFKEIAWAENQIDYYAPAAENALSALTSRFDGPVAVSYTHLDVYKRQTQNPPPLTQGRLKVS